ncbi:hypothetical protein AMEJIAPC_02687 [Caulobacter sp. NIBR1757]|nr:hypothetical protein AMEJIAPC_02687 [Caulobacter sp. NIBR1757]
MPAYRFYTLSPSGLEQAAVAVFFSDGAAMTWGFKRVGPTGIEVWQGSRFVGRLHGPGSIVPEDEPSPAPPDA